MGGRYGGPGPDGTVPLRRFLRLALDYPADMADLFCEQGGVRVNGAVERDRDRALGAGDRVDAGGHRMTVSFPVKRRLKSLISGRNRV